MSAGIRADPSGGKVYIQVDGADVLEVGSTNNIVLPNDGKIGSTGDPDSITVASNGDVTFSQTVFMTDTIAPLHVKNALNNTLLYSNAFNSRIGIKTSSPGKTLDVDGEIRTSSGILFGTDTAAANTLDDYEEGTWTPTYEGSTSNPTFTVSVARAEYVKVGKVVTVRCWFAINASAAGTGDLEIHGFPFPIDATSTGDFISVPIADSVNWPANDFPSGIRFQHNNAYGTLLVRSGSDARTGWTPKSAASLSTGSTFRNDIRFMFSYMTDS